MYFICHALPALIKIITYLDTEKDLTISEAIILL